MARSIFLFLLAVSITASPEVAFAAFDDARLTTDAVIQISGENLTVHGSTASVETIVVASANFQVTLLSGSSITVRSANRRPLTTSSGGIGNYDDTKTCGDQASTLALSNSRSTSVTVTVTIDTNNTCTEAKSSSPAGQGGVIGGGGGRTAPGGGSPAVTAALPPLVPQGVVTVAVPAQALSAVFTQTLTRGVRGEEVRQLQKLLAADKSLYPEGRITGYFGPATEQAIKRFQAKYGIVSSGTPTTTGYGLVGPKTREKLREIFGGGELPTAPPPQPAVPSPVVPMPTAATVNVTLRREMIHPQVKLLQQLLNRDSDTRVAETAEGSAGKETSYFGPATERAVKRFQEKYGIVSGGTPATTGYGIVGPKTREKLKEIFLQ